MQVVSNLIANAIYVMPTGGRLSISIEDADESASGMELTISDSGVGIAPHDLPKVFQAFFTTHTTIGTGIGLFIAKQFVEGHGGQISIRSQNDAKNHGTMVRIFLPLRAPRTRSHRAHDFGISALAQRPQEIGQIRQTPSTPAITLRVINL